jgi:hypothetical protein
MDFGKNVAITLIVILAAVFIMAQPVSSAEIRDLSGTWQIIDPDGQYSGSAAIVGGDGIAIIHTNVWIIPVTLQERFKIGQVCQGSDFLFGSFTCFDTFQVKSQYGTHYLSYNSAKDELFYGNGQPYAIRINRQ